MARAVSKLIRIAASLAAVFAITAVCYRFLPSNAATVALLYLVGVLLIATFWGLLESTVASAVAMLCFNFFFLPPILTFTIADAQNWIALFAFLTTAIIASQLSSYARRQTEQALVSKLEMERLYSLSRAILLLDEESSVASQTIGNIARVFGLTVAAIYDRYSDLVHVTGEPLPEQVEEEMKQVARFGSLIIDEERQIVITPVRLGAEPIASLATSGVSLSDGARQAVSNLVAIAIERSRHNEEVTRARVERQSGHLKATLLDAIAHEFKTPLTSIKAAVTSMLSVPATLTSGRPGTATARELMTVIDEETDRLNNLVSDAIQMARIEAGALKPKKDAFEVRTLLTELISDVDRRRDGRPIKVQIADNLSALAADHALINLALRQLLDNALRYSPAPRPIAIDAAQENGTIRIDVRDEGPGVPKSEQEHIFERFYRGAAADAQLPGSGMGLAIAREIARAHGGDVILRSEPGQGAIFSLLLPVAN